MSLPFEFAPLVVGGVVLLAVLAFLGLLYLHFSEKDQRPAVEEPSENKAQIGTEPPALNLREWQAEQRAAIADVVEAGDRAVRQLRTAHMHGFASMLDMSVRRLAAIQSRRPRK